MDLRHIFLIRGATAYELQVCRFGLRLVHLRGGYFRWWAPWRRISLQWFTAKKEAEQ